MKPNLKNPRIKPLRGLRYNNQLFKNIDKLVCPPYDVIDKKHEVALKKSSEYNFCNVLLKGENETYDDIGKKFNLWIKKSILKEEPEESFYLCLQKFILNNKTMYRHGFIGLLKNTGNQKIFPHEHTHEKPKKDRLKIISKVNANLSPIFIIYPDKENSPLERLFKNTFRTKPLIKFIDASGVENKIWKIVSLNNQKIITNQLNNMKLLIADGHHRFEVSKMFYEKNIKNLSKFKDLNYMLAYFSPSCGENILILPTHRIIRNINITTEKIKETLSDIFTIKEYNTLKAFEKDFNLSDNLSFGFYSKNKFILFCLKNRQILYKMFKNKTDRFYSKINVIILHKIIFNRLGINPKEEDLLYDISIKKAIDKGKHENGCCFFLKSIDIKEIMEVSFKKLRFPQKTTYFYPKFTSGLVMRRLKNGHI